MKTNKSRRREANRRLEAAGLVRQDRFSEMMGAIAGGGTEPCACCGLQVWASDLDAVAVCAACRAAFGKLRVRALKPSMAWAPILTSNRAEPNVVWVDASFQKGYAGLAVVGALGEHSQRVEATTSTQAETLALKWAMDIAEAGGVTGLIFRTDCEKAFNVLKHRATVEQIPRERNRRADQLANEARRG